MTSQEAIKIFFSFIQSEAVVCATGYISRSAQQAKNRPENFYMIGSMGLVSSVTLGAALCRPDKKWIALDGDGAVLMNLGTLATVGALKPANFFHVVIDNGGYESTGQQASHAREVALDRIALSAGYLAAGCADNEASLKQKMAVFLASKGPVFLRIKVLSDSVAPAPRIEATPEAITQNFMEALR